LQYVWEEAANPYFMKLTTDIVFPNSRESILKAEEDEE